jgi:hypothetical protein
MSRTPSPVGVDPSTYAADLMRVAGGWPPNAHPTGAQWAAGFRALNPMQQALIADRVMEQGQRAADCFVRNHRDLEDAYQRVYGRLSTAQMALSAALEGTEDHPPCEPEADCRICGRVDAAMLFGVALGFLEPTARPETPEDEAQA